MAELRSIHYRRRWFYVLWVALLLCSAGAWALWERPLSLDHASLAFRIQVRNAPPGTRVQAWNGPWDQWQGSAWSGDGAAATDLDPDGSAVLPVLSVQIAPRRWVRGYVPRDTWDLMVLRLTPPSGPPRYFIQPLADDILAGDLKPHWKLSTSAGFNWDKLHTDGKAPERIP